MEEYTSISIIKKWRSKQQPFSTRFHFGIPGATVWCASPELITSRLGASPNRCYLDPILVWKPGCYSLVRLTRPTLESFRSESPSRHPLPICFHRNQVIWLGSDRSRTLLTNCCRKSTKFLNKTKNYVNKNQIRQQEL